MNLLKLFVLTICIILAFLATGCSTVVPVTVKFPEVPNQLLVKCPQLKKVENEEAKLSDITKTVTINYTTYYECAVKHDAFVEWYKIQKDIFDKAGK
jgi:hypothetical protein